MNTETKTQQRRTELVLTVIVIVLSGASAGLLIFGPLEIISYTLYRDVAIIPSVIAIFAIGILARAKFPALSSRLFVGMAAGTIATFALEAIRIPGYMFAKWIPMDSMISLPGLLLTRTISSLSEVKQVIMQSGVPMNLYHAPVDIFLVGGLWHFWNGATFGIVYSLIVGKGRWWYGMIWAFVIEIGMMLAPYLIVMKGPFGIEHMDGYNLFAITLVAHLLFGAMLGIIVQRWNKQGKSIKDLMQWNAE
ncbi:hypothetical protein AAA799E16_00593 [Marine Group I thaumarchaeote SCGC AAA799-E16]|uniref:Uncharacterized protein n=4 Tax=Marine Group I TaxID=905826 RepID=A0A081RL73_9ARCH|nr:hypothetical protein AAA799N04_01626 [Marine Group I thaumarchaeote SCGC AAA799-N04]KER06676.1 hypothetical protein AAA799E16_00593 [Marine Group I thaumarchaeote SCGC AAA799-E16]KFM16153.1 hypothetical protein AAA799D11_00957 [Marine Group I thaumarchaeote SCGC AAA799-D11]KFM17890.1 hypothetical protein SCCGRSA3_01835 [Marine Group I thaumarchaeote SCGC RSA3]